MDDPHRPSQGNGSFSLPPITNPPLQFFGGNGEETSPTAVNFDFNDVQIDGQDQEGGREENDPKRRRIARVRSIHTIYKAVAVLTGAVGVRYVQKKEDQM